MTWYYQNTVVNEIPDNCIGYVYLITNTVTGRRYIGKKLFHFSKTTYKTIKLKNGKKKRKRIKGKIESDWKNYWSSSNEVKKDVEQLGVDKFHREILYYCKSKAECSYLEAREQFDRKVLESTDYYNGQIAVRVHGSHIIKSKSNGQ
jgi:hypothetical protein